MVKIRSAYDEHARVQLDTGEDGGAKQSFKDEADINVLMARYLKSGVISSLNPRLPVFMDVSDVGAGGFQAMLERLRQAEDYFTALPSEVRERFGHDAGAFVDFVADPANAQELVELGIRPSDDSDVPDPEDPGGEEPPNPEPEPEA